MSEEKKAMPKSLRVLFTANAAIITVFYAHPFDLIKARMQTIAINNPCPNSTWQCFNTVMKSDGFLGLYQGLGAAILRQSTYTVTRLSIYPFLNEAYRDVKKREPTLLANMMMGATSGAIAAMVGNPADVALVRITTDAVRQPKDRRNYKNVIHALIRICRDEGVAKLWRGCFPTVVRAVVINTAQLASYSYYRRTLKQRFNLPEDFTLFLLASTGAGLTHATCSLPVDILKTRIQNQLIINGKPEFSSVYDVFRKLIRNEGVLALWTGFVPYAMRVAPATVLILQLIEQQCKLYRMYMGVDGSVGSGF